MSLASHPKELFSVVVYRQIRKQSEEVWLTRLNSEHSQTQRHGQIPKYCHTIHPCLKKKKKRYKKTSLEKIFNVKYDIGQRYLCHYCLVRRLSEKIQVFHVFFYLHFIVRLGVRGNNSKVNVGLRKSRLFSNVLCMKIDSHTNDMVT